MAIYDPVTRQQELIANTIRGGLSEFGNRPLEKSRLSLQKAQILDQIRRNKLSDQLTQSKLDEYNRQQEELNQPLHIFTYPA